MQKRKSLYSKEDYKRPFEKQLRRNKRPCDENIFSNDFANISNYRKPRSLIRIFALMEQEWKIDPLKTLKLAVYMRIIPRDLTFDGVTTKHIGAGLKFEFIARMYWLAKYQKKVFNKNLPLFIQAGCWKDIFNLLEMDLSFNHINNRRVTVDMDYIIMYIVQKMTTDDYLKKYLPTIKPSKDCTTLHKECRNYIAKKIALTYASITLGVTDKASAYATYRRIKASGNQHLFQQYISRREYESIDFKSIPFLALKALTKGNFIESHNLQEQYAEYCGETKYWNKPPLSLEVALKQPLLDKLTL